MIVHTQSRHFHSAFTEGDFEERSFSCSNESDDIALPQCAEISLEDTSNLVETIQYPPPQSVLTVAGTPFTLKWHSDNFQLTFT